MLPHLLRVRYPVQGTYYTVCCATSMPAKQDYGMRSGHLRQKRILDNRTGTLARQTNASPEWAANTWGADYSISIGDSSTQMEHCSLYCLKASLCPSIGTTCPSCTVWPRCLTYAASLGEAPLPHEVPRQLRDLSTGGPQHPWNDVGGAASRTRGAVAGNQDLLASR